MADGDMCPIFADTHMGYDMYALVFFVHITVLATF